MYLNPLNISDDAIFIADSHYNSKKEELKQLLLDIQSNKINTSQIFLMGDIFDFLAPQISYFKNKNQHMINLINELSLNIEIIYLEGNHDFNLKKIFPNIQVFQRDNQPVVYQYQDKIVALAHGDIFTPLGYNLYTKLIRNTIFLNFINLIDINNWLSIKIDNWLQNKNICTKCTDVDKFITSRLDKYKDYNCDIIIEGHFHYEINNINYINLPSLYCSKTYYSIKSNEFICQS